MTSAVCHRFVQNAWKKERCSNCFKSKEDHISLKRETPVSKRPVTVPKSTGIMKLGMSNRRKRTVSFKTELTEIIGFGGEEWSDNEEFELDDTSPEISEDDSSNNVETELEKQTKLNTEQNANILSTTTDRRRTFTQLMLGQPQTDSDGKKQTLLVSVTPFGQNDVDRTPPKRITKTVSHIPIAKNKENLVEIRPKVILTAFSKNRDLPELAHKKEAEVTKETEALMVNREQTQKNKVEEKSLEEIIEIPIPSIESQVVDVADDNGNCLEAKNEIIGPKVIEVEIENKFVEDAKESNYAVTSELRVQLRKSVVEVAVSNKEHSESSEESTDSLEPAESREQAGEPDGRADSDVPSEPPALPRSPPPLLTPSPRTSFLHGSPRSLTDKPKVPLKPENVIHMTKKNLVELLPPLIIPQQSQQQQLDLSKLPNKRRAPNPPPTPTPEDTATNPHDVFEPTLPSNDSPIVPITVQEPETSLPSVTQTASCVSPMPKKSISMSTDNLALNEKTDEKRKDKTKTKFSLKKFLRVGNRGTDKLKSDEAKEKITSFQKPRLVIVHPLELNGAGVQVVAPALGSEELQIITSRISDITPPAPPPRNFSEKRLEDPKPPPKSEETLRKQRQLSSAVSKPVSQVDNVYANLGEVRSGLAPSKPQRTASMREREALLEQQNRRFSKHQEHLYERITPRRHSDESDKEQHRFKSAGAFALYGGSEPDLDIYSPCSSYYGSECEISENSCSRPCRLRSRKGRSIVHKNLEDNYGAVVVANHEALAQVLEQLNATQNVQPALRGLQSATVLHWQDFSLVDNSNERILIGRRVFCHALWGAHHVTLSLSKERLSMHKHPVGLGTFRLVPITEFNDLVPAKYLPEVLMAENDLIEATIAVFPWLQIDTVQTIGATIKSNNSDEMNRSGCFVMLQFVNSLKGLQAQGIEEIPLSLSNFILCQEVDRDTHHKLYLLQGLSEEVCRMDENEKFGSLCQCATAALNELFSANLKQISLIRNLLKKESAMSLSQVKSILEFTLWGPSDVALGVPIKDRELALQRWLDLERATVLHGLVAARIQLSVFEEYHLLFLVRSSAKMMCEASLLLESSGAS